MPESLPEVAPDAVLPVADVALEPDVKTPAEPSPAETKGEKGDLVSAVKAALALKEKPPASTEPDPKSAVVDPATAKKEGAEGEDEEDPTEEELAQFKPKTARRFKKLLAEKNTLRSEVDTLKPQVDEFRKVTDWFQKSGLSPAEANQTFDVAFNLKNDPKKAYETLKPIYAQLQRMFGDVLPEDLSSKVVRGEITPEVARELATARTTASIATQQNERRQQQDNERTQEADRQTFVKSVQDAVTGWEVSKEKADPDWKLKQPHVNRILELDVRTNGYPKTPTEAVERSNNALKTVNEDFRKLRPTPKQIVPTTPASSTSATPKPTSVQEAVRQALAKGRGG